MFKNDAIKRELNADARKEILKALVEGGESKNFSEGERVLRILKIESCPFFTASFRECSLGSTTKRQIKEFRWGFKGVCILEETRRVGRDDLRLGGQYWSKSKYYDIF